MLTNFAPALNGAGRVDRTGPGRHARSSSVAGSRPCRGPRSGPWRCWRRTAPGSPTFTAKTNGYVNKVLVRGSRLIAGGRFSTANAVARVEPRRLQREHRRAGRRIHGRCRRGAHEEQRHRDRSGGQEMDAERRRFAPGRRRQLPPGRRAATDAGGDDRPHHERPVDLVHHPLPERPESAAARPTSAPRSSTPRCATSSSPRTAATSSWSTTGGAPDRNVTSLCDTATRWETTTTAGLRGETWRNCTGGDTLYSVAVTRPRTAPAVPCTSVATSAGWTTAADATTPCRVVRGRGIGAIDADHRQGDQDLEPRPDPRCRRRRARRQRRGALHRQRHRSGSAASTTSGSGMFPLN